MPSQLIAFDRTAVQNYEAILGIDEAGRGALAGPVVAAAVWVNSPFLKSDTIDAMQLMVNDSKKLSSEKRQALFKYIQELESKQYIRYTYSLRDAQAIDQLNILRATHQAMHECLQKLEILPKQDGFGELPFTDNLFHFKNRSENLKKVRILIDGLPLKNLPYDHTGLIKGDAQSFSIALASIVAKVVRDDWMIKAQGQYPAYSFSEHKGYGTASHREEILTHGVTPIHRLSFLKNLEQKAEKSFSSQLAFFPDKQF